MKCRKLCIDILILLCPLIGRGFTIIIIIIFNFFVCCCFFTAESKHPVCTIKKRSRNIVFGNIV